MNKGLDKGLDKSRKLGHRAPARPSPLTPHTLTPKGSNHTLRSFTLAPELSENVEPHSVITSLWREGVRQRRGCGSAGKRHRSRGNGTAGKAQPN